MCVRLHGLRRPLLDAAHIASHGFTQEIRGVATRSSYEPKSAVGVVRVAGRPCLHRRVRQVAAFRMPPSLHAALYGGLLQAGVDAPRVPVDKIPTDDPDYNPVQELAMLWGTLNAGIAQDLEEQIATAEAQLLAAPAGDSLSRPQSGDFRRRDLSREAAPEPPSRRSLAASAQKGIACSEPPSRLEFHLWSPRSTQPARAPQKHVVVRPSGAQAALDQLQAQATFRPGSCRRSRQQRSTAPGRDRFETQVLRLSTPVAARGAEHLGGQGQVPSMRCSSTPMATHRPVPPGVAASTPGRVADVRCASPLQNGASGSQEQECREMLRHASRSTTPRAYPSAAERAYSSDSQRRRESLLYAPGSPR